jgi:hypothetical protein
VRIFRLAGVRSLLASTVARTGISRNRAKEMIRDRGAFANSDPVYVGGAHLSVDDVWRLLLERRVFLPGLQLACRWCQQTSFLSAKELDDEIRCPKCGRSLLLGPAIVGDPLRFRLSGLLEELPGRTSASDESQPEAIPVLLTLLFLSTRMSGAEGLILQTNHDLSGDAIGDCETDFVAVEYGSRPRPHTHILIGECKGRGRVDDDDVTKLWAVRQALQATNGVRCDLVFATTRDSFDQSEMDLFNDLYVGSADAEHLRTGPILLARTELESSPYGADEPDRIPGTWSGFDRIVEWSTRRHFAADDAIRITPT